MSGHSENYSLPANKRASPDKTVAITSMMLISLFTMKPGRDLEQKDFHLRFLLQPTLSIRSSADI